MASRPFHLRPEDLPRILPVFPLAGVLLLPEGRLPLNIFEPRYLAMVQDALGWGRLIGMIQPASEDEGAEAPPLYETGCAGRISSFSETEDGRFILTLTGVCRFHVAGELDSTRGYRRVDAAWTPFLHDLDETEAVGLDRAHLLAVLKPYLKLQGVDLNWKAVEAAGDKALTVTLPMALPFEPREKQALLEAPDDAARGRTLITLMEMALAEAAAGQSQVKQ
jgi:Lon protease-like protein